MSFDKRSRGEVDRLTESSVIDVQRCDTVTYLVALSQKAVNDRIFSDKK